MIHVERGRPPAGYVKRARQATEKLAAFYARDAAERGQERTPIEVRVWPREALLRRFRGKCAYCESPVREGRAANIENYRPKSLYWWLTYAWENLLIACQVCNIAKGSRFPLQIDAVRASAAGQEAREHPLLLDPCLDRPEAFLTFGDDGKVYSDDPRGQATIDMLTLNRPSLVEARRRAAEDALSSLENGYDPEIVLRRAADEVPYAGTVRQVLQRALASPEFAEAPWRDAVAEALRKVAKTSADAPKNVAETKSAYEAHEKFVESFSLPEDENAQVSAHYFAKRRTVERIRIRNFKTLRRLEIDLAAAPTDSTSWLMLLGENATGKSSVLKAVALTLMGEKRRRELGLRPDDVLTRGAPHGRVQVWLSGVTDPVELTYRAGEPEFGGARTERVLLMGYGSTRILPSPGAGAEARGHVRVESLFRPAATLVDAERWLVGLEPELFAHAARVLKLLLPLRRSDRLEARDEPKGKGRRIHVRMYGDEVTLSELSDGYQSVVALAADILSVLLPVWKELVENAEGIVLIDELDAHLHPTWRMRIVQTLRGCFPNVQFLTTSHDPLCLKGLRAGEVVVLRRSRRGRVVPVEDLPSPEGMSVDQLLTSEHFGLGTTVDPEVEKIFRRYYALLARKQRSEADERRLEELRERLARLNHMGRTRREQLMLSVIDVYLAGDVPVGRKAQEERRGEMLAKLMTQWTGDAGGGPRA